MILINIITIYKGDDFKPLRKTLKSIINLKKKSKLCINIKLILRTNRMLNIRKKYFQMIINKDHSLYNAMNLGMNNLNENSYIIFMNGGDYFHESFQIDKYANYFKTYKCLSFKVDIMYYGKYILYNKIENYLCHNSFFAPYSNIRFDEKIKISADSIWMNHNIKKFDIIHFKERSTVYEGFGLSDKPSLRTAFIYLDNQGIGKFFLRIIYLILYKILPQRLLIQILALKRGYNVKKI